MRPPAISAMRRDLGISTYLPYTAQINEHVVRTRALDYLQVFRLGGASFESVDDTQLNNWHERLNILWRNIAAPGIALWTHVIRRREWIGETSCHSGSFADRLCVKYQKRLHGETLMINELYLSVLYRPNVGMVPRFLSKALSARCEDTTAVYEALETCEKLTQTIRASLLRYEPQLLGTYRTGGRVYSRALEFLGFLVNSEWVPIPLPQAPINEVLGCARLFFGNETLEYRLPTRSRVAAILGIKEYATPSTVGAYNRLLAAPFSYVLTQSFAFLSKAAGQGLLQRQIYRMANAGDFGVSQAERLNAALDELTSNEFVMGDHHFSLQILTDVSEEEALGSGSQRLKALNDQVALARSFLADTGMMIAREDLALEAAFWAQLPGNFAMRPRKAPITSRNLAAMAAFHNYPIGRPYNNHWGEALVIFMTSARSPYYFSLHASDPADIDGSGRRDTGHTFVCGPTGSGKTVLIGFLIAMLARAGATQVVFDKDRGLEILVRALGGEYLPLRNGVPTGFNPLQLPGTALDIEFLKSWLKSLVRTRSTDTLSVRQSHELEQALRATLALDYAARRLSRLIEFLDPTDPEGVYARLARWCASTRGDYAWAFDSPSDTVVGRLAGHSAIGFDVTDFIDNEVTRTPVTLYLFHLIRQLLDGRRLVCWMDEFWRLLGDAAFETFAKDGPKTWRKLNGVMCLVTQSPSDVLQSPISRTIVEQTATKIFFPNSDALEEEYSGGFGLTEREFRLIKERIEPSSRKFLIKQGHRSIVAELELKGFDAELQVISGRVASVARMDALLREYGPKVADWLPVFLGEAGGACADA